MIHLLHHLLQASASAFPDHVAVVDGDRELTYADLDRRSNQLAHLLLSSGVSRGDRVGLYLDKSLESVVGIFGVLKAGAVYVPLDPQAPTARLGYIAGNCDIQCLLTGQEKADSWADLIASGATLNTLVVLNGADQPDNRPADNADVSVLTPSALQDQPTTAPDISTIDLDLAYVLYTSGSTGHPKGVMLSHLNALTFVNWAVDEFEVSAEDRLSSHAPLHFDLSIFDLFAAASVGATVVLVPPETSYFPIEIKRFIERNRITIWYSVPSILSMLTLRGKLEVDSLPSLRTILFAGEVFPVKYLRRLMEQLPQVRFSNLYGPTETNVCTFYEVPLLPNDRTEPIPIGKAIADVEVFAVTDEGQVAAPGEVGELWARGTTVMQGYWGDPERTARGLIPNPFGGGVRDPIYRTGDLVRQDEDGNYLLLGRRDHQIKSRGYRIELGEIESVLYAHTAVDECVVVALPDELVTNRIKAYVVCDPSIEQADLIRFCSSRLPHYMIPEMFEFCDALPKTSTGKVDRQAIALSKAQK